MFYTQFVLISRCNKELKRIATNYLNNIITYHLLAKGDLYEFVPLCQIPCRVCDIVVSILFLKKGTIPVNNYIFFVTVVFKMNTQTFIELIISGV